MDQYGGQDNHRLRERAPSFLPSINDLTTQTPANAMEHSPRENASGQFSPISRSSHVFQIPSPLNRETITRENRSNQWPTSTTPTFSPQAQYPIEHYCTVKIVGGRYDETGHCWIDEGPKKIEIEIETNIESTAVTIYCEKEGYKRVIVATVPHAHFKFHAGVWKYIYKCSPNFPAKSGVTHSPLRFIAEVTDATTDRLLTFVGNEEFFVYSKLPEKARAKKRKEREMLSDEDSQDESSLSKTDVNTIIENQEKRIIELENEIRILQNSNAINSQPTMELLNTIVKSVSDLAKKQEESHNAQTIILQSLSNQMKEITELVKKKQQKFEE